MLKNWFRCLAFVTVCALVFGLAGGSIAATPVKPTDLAPIFGEYDLATEETVTVIVELDAVSMLEAKHRGQHQTLGNLQAERNRVIRELRKNSDLEVMVNREYAHVFSGMSISLPASQLPRLAAIPGVRAIYPNVEYTVTGAGKLLSADEVEPEMFLSAPYIGAQQVWEELGVTGKGITVAVIDTGVDYTHPDLVHAFGEYKGWDFVDNDADPQETPPGDPRGGATNHGTHVAGTIAANGLLKGVAPDATLLAYRVLGPGGTGTTTNIVAGIERAVLDGADIMNLSLGNTLNNPDWATSLALDRAMEEGVVAITSNGNAGPNYWTVGSPATSRRAISVGATELPKDFFAVGMSTPGDVSYPSFELMGFTNPEDMIALDGNEYEFVYVGLGGPGDFAGLDLTDKIALIVRGEYTFLDKAANAAAAGAVGVIIFNNAPEPIGPTVGGMVIPTFKLSGADGQKMLAELAAGNNTVTFAVSHLGYMESIADFSSRGPVTGTWMIKPDVSAPGVNIVSTVPTHNPASPHGYAAFQGTSMASPHVAGAAALLLEAHPGWGVDEVKAALMNTAEVLTNPYTGQVYSHNTQGAGSIRVNRAIATDTLVVPGSYSFGHFDKAKGSQTERQHFEIWNLADQPVRYAVEFEFAGNPDGIQVHTSNNLNIQPGRSMKVNLHVRVEASKLEAGFYEGTIVIRGGSEEIRVPAILFVGELTLPLFGGALVTEAEDGYFIDIYLPGGADILYFDLYTLAVTPVADLMVVQDVPPGWSQHFWDRTAFGEPLPPDTYYLVVFVVKDGRIGGYILDTVVVP